MSCTLFIGCNSSKKMHIKQVIHHIVGKNNNFLFFSIAWIFCIIFHVFFMFMCIHFLGIPFDGYIHPPMINVCHSCMDECFSFLHNDDIHSWMHYLHSSMMDRCQLSIHCERKPMNYEYVHPSIWYIHIIVHFCVQNLFWNWWMSSKVRITFNAWH